MLTDQGSIELNADGFSISNKGQNFLSAKGPMFCPVFADQGSGHKELSLVKPGVYKSKSGPFSELRIFVKNHGPHFEVWAEADMVSDGILTDWLCFGTGETMAGFDQIVVANSNAKGPMTTGVFDKMRLGDSLHKVSHRMGLGVPSWFFPLPTNYILATYREMLFLGLDDMYDHSRWSLEYKGSTITDWRLEYGRHIRCTKGETIVSPRWIGFFAKTTDPYACWPVYTEILREKGKIRRKGKGYSERPKWWADLNYVTWGDQHVYADGKATSTYNQTETNLSEDTINRWMDIIERYKLPFRTITIDGYWCPHIGQWTADPQRFPDMRGLVDRLHKRGYKVLFWYCPYEAAKESPVYREHQEWFVKNSITQNSPLEKDVQLDVRPQYDYTRKEVRDFIREDICRILSSENGCYDGDGLKLDFFNNAPNGITTDSFADPAWGLGQRFMLKSSELFYECAKEFKPDCRIDGEGGNPFLCDYTDSMRAWDWCESDYTIYNARVKLASVLCPDVPALYDEHIHFKNLYKYCLRSAVARPIFFNVEHFHGDMHKPADEEYENLSGILNVISDLNRRAADVTPESMDRGCVYDLTGKLIAKTASDDMSLIAEKDGKFTVVLLNDGPSERACGVIIDPVEFGVQRQAVAVMESVKPNGVKVITV